MNATIAQLLAAVVPAITAALFQIGTSITQEPYALELIRIAGVNQREKNATKWCYCTASYSSQFCKLTDAVNCAFQAVTKLFFLRRL